ncbi:DUF4189 domain-containing protein [Xanthomonas arboricola]|uniref:DUF4189 domain-containing protein n=2 Tax=Xanthomonas TaxID=338 RepID=A0AB73GZL4_9XANT|nr:DUF4189 domain-containing protein [Xanthomonas arboricola]MBB5671569.1 hypothetical protein [Xanthomonas arboricola]QWN01163.1 hypothetical protein DGN21_19080 [Xanthomonas sp. MLO165]
MIIRTITLLLSLLAATSAMAEEGCPAGQIPAQAGAGVTSCGPIPQGYYQQNKKQPPRAAGKWLKTWGAVAVGILNDKPLYAVPVGLASEDAAKKEALDRCNKSGAKGCRPSTTFRNQCMSIGEPQIEGSPKPDGIIEFSRQPTEQLAKGAALRGCSEENPGAECKIIHTACSEQIFEKF